MCKIRTRKFCFSSFFVPTTEPPTALLGCSSADDIDRSNADVRRDIREPHDPPRRPVCLGFLEAFRTYWVASQPELHALSVWLVERYPHNRIPHMVSAHKPFFGSLSGRNLGRCPESGRIPDINRWGRHVFRDQRDWAMRRQSDPAREAGAMASALAAADDLSYC